jgi:tetratricopeptide (TPR) repeat protein
MKAITRFLLLLLLVCGTIFVCKTNDRQFRRFSEDGSHLKEEGEMLQEVLQPAHASALSQPAWSKAEFQTRLEEAFQKNEPCVVIELLRDTRDAPPREFWSSGMAVLLSLTQERSPLFGELLASPSSPFYGIPESSTRTETQFFNALFYSGQLRGLGESNDTPRRHGSRNLDRAIEIFRSLAQKDPENGIFPFFLSSALRLNGAKKEEVRAALSQASKALRFDPYYQSIFDNLQSVAFRNAATFAFVHIFLEFMPAPDYEQGIHYLKYWAHSEEPGKWIALRLAKRMAELGAGYKKRSPGYQFSRSEYVLGQNLKFTVEGKMEKSWEEYMKLMRAAQEFISESPQAVVDAESSLYRERIENKLSCGPDIWKTLYAAYKAKNPG